MYARNATCWSALPSIPALVQIPFSLAFELRVAEICGVIINIAIGLLYLMCVSIPNQQYKYHGRTFLYVHSNQ